MKPSDYFCFGLYLLVPLAFMVWWVRMRLGFDKRWFVIPAAPIISRNFYFALPTAMLGIFVMLVGVLFIALDPKSNEGEYLLYIAFGLWGVSFIFAYLEPDWMSPPWYRWIKKEHGDILPYLAEEAHELGREEWLKRVQTQEDLERWVEDFRRKHGL